MCISFNTFTFVSLPVNGNTTTLPTKYQTYFKPDHSPKSSCNSNLSKNQKITIATCFLLNLLLKRVKWNAILCENNVQENNYKFYSSFTQH